MLHFMRFGLNGTTARLFAPDDALSHDRWSDFDDDLTRLDAIITDINISGSDPTLQVRANNGVNWTIELGSHSRNRKAGLEDAQILPGEPVQVVGRCTHHLGENRIKAIKLTLGDRDYRLYPDQAD